MKNLFTESLAGRKFIFELFPLNFREFLLFKDVKVKIPEFKINKAIFETIVPLYDEYLLFGGFPGVVLKGNIEEKKRALDEIFSSFFQLEVIQLGDFKRNEVIRDLMLLLAQRIGSKLDIQRLSRELGISRATLGEYISFLEGTYFISLIRPFSKGKNNEIRKMPKVYLCDTGLANHLAKLELGRIFENSIFQNLRQKGEIHYYRKKSGIEIDFILNRNIAYEVKINPNESDLNRLKGLTQKLGIKEYKIIAKEYSELEDFLYGFSI